VVGLCVATFSSAYILDERRYQLQTTKSSELAFLALLDSNGARNVRFAWATTSGH
jgi:hypothetical protein